MSAETFDRLEASPDPKDRVALGCNECDNHLTNRQVDADPAADFGWKDLGDDGVLCPSCASNAALGQIRELAEDEENHDLCYEAREALRLVLERLDVAEQSILAADVLAAERPALLARLEALETEAGYALSAMGAEATLHRANNRPLQAEWWESRVSALRAALTTPAPVSGAAQAEACVWTADETGAWLTGCGKSFAFFDDHPANYERLFCPYCGKPLKEAATDESEAADA